MAYIKQHVSIYHDSENIPSRKRHAAEISEVSGLTEDEQLKRTPPEEELVS
jgi:hypothetical protein